MTVHGSKPTAAEFRYASHWRGNIESNGEAVPPATNFCTWVLDHRCADIAATQQFLQRANVGASLQHIF
jgi:hypothetical protein